MNNRLPKIDFQGGPVTRAPELLEYNQTHKELRVALENLSDASDLFGIAMERYNDFKSIGDASYTSLVFTGAQTVLNSLKARSGAIGCESIALESVDFDPKAVAANIKKIALAIWEKVKALFSSAVDLFRKYLLKYIDKNKVISGHLRSIGNAMLRGKLELNRKTISSLELPYEIGELDSERTYPDFMDFYNNYATLVGDPIDSAIIGVQQVIKNKNSNAINLREFERNLGLSALRILANFTESAPYTVKAADIMPGAKFTKNFFAGAHLQASGIIKKDNIGPDMKIHGYQGTIVCTIAKSRVDRPIDPLLPQQILELSSIIGSKSEWNDPEILEIATKAGKDLLGVVNDMFLEVPDEDSAILAKDLVSTFNSIVYNYLTASFDAFSHAALTMMAIAEKSYVKK